MVRADSKTGAGEASRPATRYPGNNLCKQPDCSSRLTDGRLFCPLRPETIYYKVSAMARPGIPSLEFPVPWQVSSVCLSVSLSDWLERAL